MRSLDLHSAVTALALILSAGARTASADVPPRGSLSSVDVSILAPLAIDRLEINAPPPEWFFAPLPGRARNYAVPPDRTIGAGRVAAHALLGLPRIAWEVAEAPVRGTLYLFGRYNLDYVFVEVFFNEARTFGVFPVVTLDTRFGVSGGARLVHTDLFGEGESVRADAIYGGPYLQAYDLAIRSGDRFGERLNLGLRARYEDDLRERFFGIGNAGKTEVTPELEGVNALSREVTEETRYRAQIGSLIGRGRYLLVGDLSLSGGSALRTFDFGRAKRSGSDPQLEEVFDTGTVIGFNEGIDDWYNEVSLDLVSRKSPDPFISRAVPSGGVVARARLGYHTPLSVGYDGFFRYGLDLQAFFNLYRGDRVLRLRLLAEEVDGALEEIPFALLPTLGGKQILRGYENNRFRDRAFTLATAEYMFPLGGQLSGILFSDAGRVQRSLDETEIENLRVGYGFAVQVHSLEAFIARAQIASSIDGGLFLDLAFSPTLSSQPNLLKP